MNIALRAAFAACIALSLGGCQHLQFPAHPPFERTALAKFDGASRREETVELRELLDGAAPAADGKPPSYDALLKAFDQKGDKLARNRVVDRLLTASSTNCAIFTESLRGAQMTARLSTDLASSLFSTSATVMAHPSAAKTLSALSALTVSSGSSIDRNIFAQQGAELIADAINNMRKLDLVKIENSKKLDYEVWPVAAAIHDVTEYHSDCSVTRAFSVLRNELAGREAAIAAVRRAAAAVQQADGSPSQVVAVLAGLDPRADASAAMPPPGREEILAEPADLAAIMAKTSPCLDALLPAAAPKVDLTSAGAFDAPACAPQDQPLLKRILTTALAPLKDANAAEVKALNTDDSAGRAKAATALRGKVLALATSEASKVAANRLAAVQAAYALAARGQTAKEVKAALTALKDSDDQAFMVMLAAVGALPDTATAQVAADVAYAEAVAFAAAKTA